MIFDLNQNNKGFTLIELLVVVAIISLLSSVVMSSINSARMKTRNVTRIDTARTIVNALNLGLGDAGLLPTVNFVCLTETCYGTTFGGASTNNAEIDALLATSLPKRPADSYKGLRNDGGIVYFGNVNPGYGFPVSAYIDYILEKPVSSCGLGKPRVSSTNWLECLVPLK